MACAYSGCAGSAVLKNAKVINVNSGYIIFYTVKAEIPSLRAGNIALRKVYRIGYDVIPKPCFDIVPCNTESEFRIVGICGFC